MMKLRLSFSIFIVSVLISLVGPTVSSAEILCQNVFQLEKRITVLERLKKGQSIPRQVFFENKTSDVALEIIPKLNENNNRIIVNKKSGFNPKDGSDIMMFFRAESIDSIIDQGFMNYHQIGTTGGDSTKMSRANQEDYLLGYNIEEGGYDTYFRESLIAAYNKGGRPEMEKVKKFLPKINPFNQFRPKYAYMVIRDQTVDIGNVVFRNQYGHYGAVFKEEVKARSTWTPVDSLAAGPNDVFTFTNDNVRIKAYGDKDTKYYFEAQIWGELEIKNVAYWIVPYGTHKESQVYKSMLKTGIPIREYQLEETVYKASGNVARRPVISN